MDPEFKESMHVSTQYGSKAAWQRFLTTVENPGATAEPSITWNSDGFQYVLYVKKNCVYYFGTRTDQTIHESYTIPIKNRFARLNFITLISSCIRDMSV